MEPHCEHRVGDDLAQLVCSLAPPRRALKGVSDRREEARVVCRDDASDEPLVGGRARHGGGGAARGGGGSPAEAGLDQPTSGLQEAKGEDSEAWHHPEVRG